MKKELIFFLVVLLVVGNPAIGLGQITFKRSAVDISSKGITMSDVRPRVQLLVGEEKVWLDWIPTAKPEVNKTSVSTPLGRASETRMTWHHTDGFQLDWILTQLEEEAFTLNCKLTNNSGNDIKIRRIFNLYVAEGNLKMEGKPEEWMVSSRYLKYHKYYNPLNVYQKEGQLVADNGSRGYRRDIYFEEDLCFYKNGNKNGLSMSAVGDVAYMEAFLQLPKTGKMGLDITSEMSGTLLEAGESRLGETILFQFDTWKRGGDKIAKWMTSIIKPRGTKPLYGWCSWYSVGSHVTQEQCYKLNEVIEKNLDRYPVQTVQIDDGWQVGRHCWLPNKKFDKGMGALAVDIKKTKAMPGIWVTTISPNNQRIIDGKLSHDYGRDGEVVRSFDESWYVGYRNGKPLLGNLDPSTPGAKEYITSMMKTLYNQGYRYFKTDFSQVARIEDSYFNPKLTSFEIQRLHYALIRQAIGEDSYLLACNGGPVRAILGLADATRIGTDTGTRWGFCNNDKLIGGKPANVHGGWFPILQIGAASAYTKIMACDPDVTRLDNVGYAKYDPRFNGMNPRNPEEKMPIFLDIQAVQTFHGIQGLYGGAMMVSDLIYKEGYKEDNRMRMYEIMQPVTPDKGYNFNGGFDVLSRQYGFVAERPWGKFISGFVWNPDHEKSADLKIDKFPTESIGDKFHMWSFWGEDYIGIKDKAYVFKDVPSYHSRLLRLTPVQAEDVPTLVGSNLHMSMGSAELKHVSASSGKISIELIPTAGALEGQLAIYSESPLALINFSGCEAFVTQLQKNVYCVVVTERKRNKNQRLDLAVTEQNALSFEEIKSNTILNKQWEAGTMTLLK